MKSILVIGGSSGIGKSTVDLLLEEGHNVVATYNTNEIVARPNLTPIHLDVANVGALDLPEVLDGMVYCPGSLRLKPFLKTSVENIADDFQTNCLGLVQVLQQAIPLLKKSSSASVVMFSSVAVKVGFGYHTAISMSKGAIEGLSKTLAAEFAPVIRFNVIAPSLVHTSLTERLLSSDDKIEANKKRHPLNAVGDPNEIAKSVSYLLSQDSSWMSGQVLHIDGGMSSIK
jgi:NAD(P)-dependent dehydrogenase (short-subunit alcohol dehydrogenase family)